MTFGSRLKEERIRLGRSQADFAALAGAKKGTQISWEKDATSPSAQALIAFGKAGADIVYILTGKRFPDRVDPIVEMTHAELDEVERHLINPALVKLAGESDSDAEMRIRTEASKMLARIVEHEAPGLPSELLERAKSLLCAAGDPHSLSLLRAADFAQAHKRREEEKEMLGIWLEQWPYQPDHPVLDIMARIALEYRVPHRLLVELSQEISKDIEEQQSANRIISLSDEFVKNN